MRNLFLDLPLQFVTHRVNDSHLLPESHQIDRISQEGDSDDRAEDLQRDLVAIPRGGPSRTEQVDPGMQILAEVGHVFGVELQRDRIVKR